MSHLSISLQKPFTTSLVKSGFFKPKPMVVVDVGARGDFEEFWSFFYGDQVSFIGFEPDRKECEKLNKNFDSNKHIYPVALGKEKERKTFYKTIFPDAAGLYQPNEQYYNRFFDFLNLRVVGTEGIETVDLDSVVKENDIKYVDYIKVDVEGAELDVLEGAEKLLENNVLAIRAEVLFVEAHKNRPLFSEIEMFLRKKGFMLYGLYPMQRLRNALPGRLYPEQETVEGQIVCGETIFFRDAVAEIQGWRPTKMVWDKVNVIKLASMLEVYHLKDCAVELLQVAKYKGILEKEEANGCIDLLASNIEGINSYKQYFEYLKVKEVPHFLQIVMNTRPHLIEVANKVLQYYNDQKFELMFQTIIQELGCVKEPCDGIQVQEHEWQKYFYSILCENIDEDKQYGIAFECLSDKVLSAK